MSLKPEIQGASIVVRGSFNPKIYQPMWFQKYDLIREEEAENAEIKIIHNEVTDISFGRFKLLALHDRFVISTTDASFFEPIRDLTLSTFSILEHTPVTAIGLNLMMHYKLASKERLESFFTLIALTEIWSSIIKDPQLTSLTITDIKSDEPQARLNLKIEPSKRVENGIYFEANNHYGIENNNIQMMFEILRDSWSDNIKSLNHVVESLLSLKY